MSFMLKLIDFQLFKIESKVEKEYNLETHRALLKEDVDTRIESLKIELEGLRDNLHSEIDIDFDEFK